MSLLCVHVLEISLKKPYNDGVTGCGESGSKPLALRNGCNLRETPCLEDGLGFKFDSDLKRKSYIRTVAEDT